MTTPRYYCYACHMPSKSPRCGNCGNEAEDEQREPSATPKQDARMNRLIERLCDSAEIPTYTIFKHAQGRRTSRS